MTPRDSHLSPSAAPTRPLRKRCASATAGAAASLLALQALVGRTDACSVGVTNNYNVSLSLYSYNGYDHICADPYQTASVQPGYDSKSTLIGRPPVFGLGCNSQPPD